MASDCSFDVVSQFEEQELVNAVDQTRREVKTLTDDAWARLQQIRARRHPNGLFADYLAGPGGL